MRIITTILITSFTCYFAWSQDSLRSIVTVNNEKEINSKELDFSPAFYEDGIVFISSRQAGKNYLYKDKNIKYNNMSIFVSKRAIDGKLGEPIAFSDDLNTKLHEGPLTFNRTQDVIYFTRNNINNGKIKKDKKGKTRMKIFMATNVNSKWSNQIELPFNSDEFDNCHPSIDVVDSKLFFSSNRPGGYGGMDLYVCEKNGDKWSEPKNLGPKVNTDKNEIFPFIHADGTLFFSSDGHEGIGQIDIFLTKPYRDDWTTPENLGAPYNSPFDDLGFIVDWDKKNGYFSSNRPEGLGQDDIYSFTTTGKVGEPDEELLKVNASMFLSDKITGNEMDSVKITYIAMENLVDADVVTDADGNVISISGQNGDLSLMPIETMSAYSDAEGKIPMRLKPGKYIFNLKKEGYQTKQLVKIIDKDNNEFLVLMEPTNNTIALKGSLINQLNNGAPIPGATVTITDLSDQSTEVLTSDLEGKFEFPLKCTHNYNISATKKGFNTVEKQLTVVNCAEKEIIRVIELSGFSSSLVEGSVIRLPNIYYNFNDATIRPDATKDLDAVAALLAMFTDIKIELSSHTDARGPKDYNNRLSQKRADNALEYLKNKGVDVPRIKAVGYGEKYLKNKCKDGVSCSELEHQYNRRTEVKILYINNGYSVEYINNPPAYVGGKDNVVFGEVPNTDESNGNVPTSSNNTSNTTINSTASNLVQSGTFWVVAGTYKDDANANKQLLRVKDAGFDAVIETDGALKRVVVGKFTDFYEARNFKENVEAKRIEAFVKKL